MGNGCVCMDDGAVSLARQFFLTTNTPQAPARGGALRPLVGESDVRPAYWDRFSPEMGMNLGRFGVKGGVLA